MLHLFYFSKELKSLPETKLNIRTLSHLAYRLGIPLEYLKDLRSRVDTLYRYWSKKKSSGAMRQFSSPKPELKKIQKRLNGLFKCLTYPTTSHYGITGRSNVTNALTHGKPKVLLNLDLKNFFPSIHPNRVFATLIRELGCSPKVASVITRLVTVKNQLPQGAPTSTYIANMVTIRLQRRLNALALQWTYKFTSYADDLSFSSENNLEGFKIRVCKIIVREGFSLRKEKESVATKSEVQCITGVNLGHTVGISRQKRKLWSAERFNANRDYANNIISEEILKKIERRHASRMVYVNSVTNISKRVEYST
jgi:hypothetical protein